MYCVLVRKQRVAVSRESADPHTIEWNIIHILCDSIRADTVEVNINKYAMAVGQDFVSKTVRARSPHSSISAINLQTWLLNVKL